MQQNVLPKLPENLRECILDDGLCYEALESFALSRNWICADCMFEICLNVNGGVRRRLSFKQLWYYLELTSDCFDFLSPPMLVGENRIALIGIESATDGYGLCDFLNLTRKLMGDSEDDGYDCFLCGSFISEGEIDCMLKLQNERDHLFVETDGLELWLSEF